MSRNRIISYRHDLRDKARQLRRESTACEIEFWLQVKNKKLLGYQFHRQVPILNFIVDFYCHELMLGIEIDGSSHDSEKAKNYDIYRQALMEERGLTFLRFSNTRIKNEMHAVLDEIKVFIRTRASTSPLPPSKGD